MGLVPTHIFIVLGVLVSGIAIVWVLGQRRSPQSALAWIIFIVSVPYVGVPLFFALGTRKRGARYDKIDFAARADLPVLDPLDDALRHLGAPPAEAGNAFRLIVGPEEARSSVEAIIEGAETRLDVTLYRLDPDPISEDFVERLTRAAERGVEVRMMLDQFGTWRRPRKALRRLVAAGGEVRLFAGLPQFNTTGRMNLRNHRKMVIADGRAVWSGGRNVGRFYLGPAEDPQTWHDLGFLLEGPGVFRFCEVFAADWAKAGGVPGEACPIPGEMGADRVQLVASGPDIWQDPLHDALVHAIHGARKRVWIATPYFLPTDELFHALYTLARIGVELRIMVPATSNQRVTDFARGPYLRGLHEVGAEILRFGPGMMHAKAIVIDDVAFVGSANFDIRSMLLNFETMLVVYDEARVAEIADWFEGLAGDCARGVAEARPTRRLAEAVFRLGAPML